MSLGRAMATVGGLTGLSRLAGFVRDVMTASFLGAGPVGDAFFVALKLPNFFRNVAAEGAFSVAFVPIYSEKLTRDGEAAAARFAGQSFTVMTVILSVFCALVMLAMPWMMVLIAPGFAHGTPRYDMAVALCRIMFPYLLLMSLSALAGGMLNAHEKFGPFASTSVFFNLTQIAVMLMGTRLGDPGRALAWSVSVSGVIQLARLLWYLRKYGIPLPLPKPRITADVRRLFSQMLPGVMGAGIIQVNLFADIIIASLLPVGGISAVYYAERLFQLPLGVVGIAVGTALLPLMTKALAAGKAVEANDLFNRSLEYCLFFTAPAAAALMLAHHEILTALFQHGKYTAADAARASPALACLAFGLPAYVGTKIFNAAYWSRHDTKTPVRISSSMALVNIGVALVMTRFIDVAGIAFATGLAGWIQCYFLWRGLRGVDVARFDAKLRSRILRIAICTVTMSVGVVACTYMLHEWFFGRQMVRLAALAVMMGVSALLYFGTAHLTGVFKVQDLTRYVSKRRKKLPPTEMVDEITEII